MTELRLPWSLSDLFLIKPTSSREHWVPMPMSAWIPRTCPRSSSPSFCLPWSNRNCRISYYTLFIRVLRCTLACACDTLQKLAWSLGAYFPSSMEADSQRVEKVFPYSRKSFDINPSFHRSHRRGKKAKRVHRGRQSERWLQWCWAVKRKFCAHCEM